MAETLKTIAIIMLDILINYTKLAIYANLSLVCCSPAGLMLFISSKVAVLISSDKTEIALAKLSPFSYFFDFKQVMILWNINKC